MILRRGAAIVLIASLPILVAALFARAFLDGSPATAIPYLSDEVAYWTQIAAFQVMQGDAAFPRALKAAGDLAATIEGFHSWPAQ